MLCFTATEWRPLLSLPPPPPSLLVHVSVYENIAAKYTPDTQLRKFERWLLARISTSILPFFSPVLLSSVLVVLPTIVSISNYRSLRLLGVFCILYKTENMYDYTKFANLQSPGRTVSNLPIITLIKRLLYFI